MVPIDLFTISESSCSNLVLPQLFFFPKLRDFYYPNGPQKLTYPHGNFEMLSLKK